ncbi:hypothetical protein JTE90_023929 [Oedothorax gibbosus]|uniref:Uncharacterized protein n=1 Tax=Oedothorax gibbosus TaxID=931172 RepID=A0AAV6URK6_9ARAC|nr:hypothetical protein JTE90_023929 [Oedothorax gibbosus]
MRHQSSMFFQEPFTCEVYVMCEVYVPMAGRKSNLDESIYKAGINYFVCTYAQQALYFHSLLKMKYGRPEIPRCSIVHHGLYHHPFRYICGLVFLLRLWVAKG